jgi:hypothetical protein
MNRASLAFWASVPAIQVRKDQNMVVKAMEMLRSRRAMTRTNPTNSSKEVNLPPQLVGM